MTANPHADLPRFCFGVDNGKFFLMINHEDGVHSWVHPDLASLELLAAALDAFLDTLEG